MEIKLLSIYLGHYDVYGIEILNIDKNRERGLFCFTFSPKVAIWIDILFFRIHIEL